MRLSSKQLRDDYQTALEKWRYRLIDQTPQPANSQRQNRDEHIALEIQQWGEHFEKAIQEKVRLLIFDFTEYPLKGEYLRSVTESFADLERLFRSQKTIMDIVQNADKQKNDLSTVLHQLRNHYSNYLVPVLNILSKLENDYRSMAIQAIAKQNKALIEIDKQVKSFTIEKNKIRMRFMDFNKKKNFTETIKKIKVLAFRKKNITLALQHIKLNLYYFNHDRPELMKAFKEKTDFYRKELQKNKTIPGATSNYLYQQYHQAVLEYQKAWRPVGHIKYRV